METEQKDRHNNSKSGLLEEVHGPGTRHNSSFKRKDLGRGMWYREKRYRIRNEDVVATPPTACRDWAQLFKIDYLRLPALAKRHFTGGAKYSEPTRHKDPGHA